MPDSSPAPLKDWFMTPDIAAIARDLAAVAPGFDRKRFLETVLDGLEERSSDGAGCISARWRWMPRCQRTYRQKVGHLCEARAGDRPRIRLPSFLSDFVATFGLDDFDFSLAALRRVHGVRLGGICGASVSSGGPGAHVWRSCIDGPMIRMKRCGDWPAKDRGRGCRGGCGWCARARSITNRPHPRSP